MTQSAPSPQQPPDVGKHPDPQSLRGSDCLARLLSEWGAETLFTYPGTSELALCETVLRTGKIKVVNARGDGEAVLFAAGANLSRRDIATCLLHGARGATNALGAIADIRRNEVPLVVIIGLPSSTSAKFLPPHAEPDLITGLRHFAKSALELPSGPFDQDSGEELVAALRAVRSEALRVPCGPVLIGVPANVLNEVWLPAGKWPAPSPAVINGGDKECTGYDVRTAASWLREALRPVVLLDDYALCQEGSHQALLNFARAFSLPLMQVRYDRGPMLFQTLSTTANPYFVARYDPASPRHREVLSQADLLVTIEDRNMYPRVVGPLSSERHIAVTSAPDKAVTNGYLRPEDIVLAGDVVLSLRRLAEHAGTPAGHPGQAARRHWADTVREMCSGGPQPPASRSRLAAGIAAHLDGLTAPVLVDDSQIFGGLLAENYHLLPERLRVFGDHGGFVGAGLATAIGAALGNSQWDVVCCVGDSALINGFKAWFSGIEQHARLTCVVCNNGGSVSLRKQAAGDHGAGSLLPRADLLRNMATVRYGQLCAGLGIPYWHVLWTTGEEQEPERLASALAAARRADGPAMVEIQVPDSLEFWEGLWRLRGFDELLDG
jgi:acetolactate synthase I/II/III large subunit